MKKPILEKFYPGIVRAVRIGLVEDVHETVVASEVYCCMGIGKEEQKLSYNLKEA